MTATIPTRTVSSRETSAEIYYPDGDGKPMAESDLHRGEMFNCIDGLQYFFYGRNDVYVAGNNFLYYRQGIPRLFVSPDCYVVFRRWSLSRANPTKSWEEQAATCRPCVIEITSDSTRNDDLERKFNLYQDVLLIPEYIMFDPNADYIGTRLTVYAARHYRAMSQSSRIANGRLHSEQLGLDLFVQGESFAFL